MTTDDHRRAAAILLAAWSEGRPVADLPAALAPATLADAYAIQDAVLRLKGGSIGGWKIAAGTAGEPRCAPLPAAAIQESPAVRTAAGTPSPRIEVEVAARFGRALPPRGTPYGPADLADAIASLHPALELLSSRFIDNKAVSPLSALADSHSNTGVVLGAPVAAWQGIDLGRVSIGLFYDGKPAGEAEGGPGTRSVLATLAWLANHAAARRGGLKAGEIVITGARIGPLPVPPGTLIEADLLSLGRVSLALMAEGAPPAERRG